MKRLLGGFIAVALLFWGALLQAEEVTTQQGDITLRGELELAEGKSLKNGVVLMLHGSLAHNKMEIMQTLAELLHEKGYNTLRVNLGFGIDKRPSEMLDCAIEHHHQHADAVTELGTWMEWLKGQEVGKVTLLGHSRGGNQVAWYAAEHDSDMLGRLVMIAPATWDSEAIVKAYEEKNNKALADILAEAQKLTDEGKGDTLMNVPEFVHCGESKVTANAMLGYYKPDERRDTPALLPKIHKPMLLVMGSEDAVVAGLPAKLENLKLDNLTVETIDGADHFFMDLYADELADKIADFAGSE